MTDDLNLQFRFAELKDVYELVDINIDGEEKYREINERMFRDLVEKRLVICALFKDEIVALIYWRDEFLGRFRQWYLKQITVKKEKRNKGIGLKLLNYFLSIAKENEIEKVFADIHNDNFASLIMALSAGGLISGFIEGVGNTSEKDERVIVRFELS